MRTTLTATVGLAAYLTVFVTAPAWHDHDGHGHAGHDHAGHTHDHAGHTHEAAEEEEVTGCDHVHAAADRPTAEEGAPADPHGGHDCRLCELLAQCPLPVTPPAVADAGDPLPSAAAIGDGGAEAKFLRTHAARGPPRA